MSRLGRAKARPLRVLKAFFTSLRPLVRDEEPLLSPSNDLISFKTWDDSFPTWVTEKLRLGDWKPLTQRVSQYCGLSSVFISIQKSTDAHAQFHHHLGRQRI